MNDIIKCTDCGRDIAINRDKDGNVIPEECPVCMGETNTCDKCGVERYTENLIWIIAEDFEPLDGETVKPEAFEKYQALCDPCYYEELI